MMKTTELPDVETNLSPSCKSCIFNRTCAVFITANNTVNQLNAQFGKEGLQILKEVSWKPEDLAKGCDAYLPLSKAALEA